MDRSGKKWKWNMEGGGGHLIGRWLKSLVGCVCVLTQPYCGGGLLNHYCACRSETGQSSLNHLLAFFSSSWIQKTACVPDKQRLNHFNSAIFQSCLLVPFKWHLDSNTDVGHPGTPFKLWNFSKRSAFFSSSAWRSAIWYGFVKVHFSWTYDLYLLLNSCCC